MMKVMMGGFTVPTHGFYTYDALGRPVKSRDVSELVRLVTTDAKMVAQTVKHGPALVMALAIVLTWLWERTKVMWFADRARQCFDYKRSLVSTVFLPMAIELEPGIVLCWETAVSEGNGICVTRLIHASLGEAIAFHKCAVVDRLGAEYIARTKWGPAACRDPIESAPAAKVESTAAERAAKLDRETLEQTRRLIDGDQS